MTTPHQSNKRFRLYRGYPGRLTRLLISLEHILRRHNHLTNAGNKVCGRKTAYNRRRMLVAAFKVLHTKGYKLENVKNTRPKHIQAILDDWQSSGLCDKTLKSYRSSLYVFLRWINKGSIIHLVDYAHPPLERLSQTAKTDKSLSAFGLDPDKVLAQICIEDTVVGVQCLLMQVFGLRTREACLLRPHRDDQGAILNVVSGTKGGRPRKIPIENDGQRTVLNLAKQFANTTHESTIPATYTCKQWIRHLYYIVCKVGLTRAKSGATLYAFRTAHLNDLYEQVAGFPPPVRGGSGKRVDPDADRRARQAVAERAGHCRLQISNSYCGGSY